MAQRSVLVSALVGGAIGAVIGAAIGFMLGTATMPRTNFEGAQGYHALFITIPLLGTGFLVGGVVGLAFGSFVGAGRVPFREKKEPNDSYLFPALEEIRSMRVRSWRPDPQTAEVAFAVPEECWETFLSVLSDAQRDPHPFKWETLAELEIRTHDRPTIAVSLCNLPDYPLGAFFVASVGSYDCYRGGSTALFRQILAVAWDESQE